MPKTNSRTIRQKVEALLREDVENRNDDKLLIINYWKVFDGINVTNGLTSVYDVLHHATQPESITRARRLIQEEGKYLPTKDIVLGRRSKKRKMEFAIQNREVV